MKNQDIDHGKILAVDPHGEDRAIDITKNARGFGEFEFDGIAAEIQLNSDNFSTSWVTTKLLETARENHALFFLKDA